MGSMTRPVARAMRTWLALAVLLALPAAGCVKRPDAPPVEVRHHALVPQGATIAVAMALDAPVEAILFYEDDCPYGAQLAGYFDVLAQASRGVVRWRKLDHAVDLTYQLRANGHVVFEGPERSFEAWVTPDLDRDLADPEALDELVRWGLAHVSEPQPRVWVLGSAPEADAGAGGLGHLDTLLSDFRVEVLDAMPPRSVAPPALIVLAAGPRPLDPTLGPGIAAHLDEGGRLLVLGEPGGRLPLEVEGRLGVNFAEAGPDPQQSEAQAIRVAPERHPITLDPRRVEIAQLRGRSSDTVAPSGPLTMSRPTPIQGIADLSVEQEVLVGPVRGGGLPDGPLAVAFTGDEESPFRAVVLGSRAPLTLPEPSEPDKVFAAGVVNWLVSQQRPPALRGRHRIDPGAVPLWEDEGTVERVVLVRPEGMVSLELETLDHRRVLWVTLGSSEGGPEPVRFLANSTGIQVFLDAASPSIMRRLHAEDHVPFGFERGARVEVHRPSGAEVIELGDDFERTHHSGVRYGRHEGQLALLWAEGRPQDRLWAERTPSPPSQWWSLLERAPDTIALRHLYRPMERPPASFGLSHAGQQVDLDPRSDLAAALVATEVARHLPAVDLPGGLEPLFDVRFGPEAGVWDVQIARSPGDEPSYFALFPGMPVAAEIDRQHGARLVELWQPVQRGEAPSASPHACADERCIEGAFRACSQATFAADVPGVSIRYEILGPADGRCRVSWAFEANPNPDLVGQPMTCSLGAEQSLQVEVGQAMTAVLGGQDHRCEGPLVERMTRGM